MDDILLKQLVRQVKILNIWVSVFGTLVIAGLLILLFLIFKVVTYVHDTTERLTSLQEQTQKSLDLKSKICTNTSLKSFLGNDNDLCK